MRHERTLMVGAHRHRLLGELLIEGGIISYDQLRIALTEQKKGGEQLGRLLIRLGFVTEAIMREALGEVLGQESIALGTVVPDVEALELVPRTLARRFNVIPISYTRAERLLTVAMPDTFNLITLDRLRAEIGGDVEIESLLAGETEISDAIDKFYGYELSINGILHEIETGEIDYESLQTETEAYSHPLVRLVNAILSDAVRRSASDIHFEPEEGYLRVRYRIDGVLRQIRSLHSNYWSAIAVRLKVMSGMNIAETRAPQDGRFSLSIAGHQVDFRVSSLRTTHGENIVLRVLDRQKGIVPIEQLGLPEDTLSQVKLMMARPEGIVLVTGPTGSGKTTTLYSILNELNAEGRNIMTLEDPVEYPMTMIRQTSINEVVKLDFANGIRALMRQDPDIILIGEVRDEATAEMAFRAAMTGHQVYTTLHTGSALGAFPRLVDIGVLPDVLAGNIIGVLAQRLVRKLCLECREPYEPDNLERLILDIGEYDEDFTIFRAQGCPACDNQGYRGRMALMEVLRMDTDLDELIARRATVGEIAEAAMKKDFRPISEDGVRRVREGVTSLDEVSRVIDLTGRIRG